MTEYPKRDPHRCPTHPGALLREIIVPALSLSKTSLAKSLGISRQTLYDLLAERQPVTPAMALRLQAAFGRSAIAWLNMQLAYDLWHAERTVDVSNIRLLQEAG
jgi:antitoxin HigA-1